MPAARRSRVSSIVAIPAWLVLALASGTNASDAVGSIPRRAIAETYQQYDFDSERLDEKECRDDMEQALCPSAEEEHIPCSGLDVVEKYCRRILGEDLVQSTSGAEGRGLNALEGCKNYVSWDDDRLNCCPSDHCFEVTGEDEWGEWELVDEDAIEDEGLEYEYADVLYDEDDSGSDDVFDDEGVEFDEDEEEYEDEDEDEDSLFPEDGEDDLQQVDGEDDLQQVDGDTRRLDDTFRKLPFVHVPPSST